ncbi:MAG: hypothetical protein M1816_002488 [Peltula sp. TS41687]|nr:MAG: hypothetical protein M1816_002488 [Peltula sp. TS41687]
MMTASAVALLHIRQMLARWNDDVNARYVEGLTEMQRDPEFKKCVDKRYDPDEETRLLLRRLHLLKIFEICRAQQLARFRGESIPEEPEETGQHGLQNGPRDPYRNNDISENGDGRKDDGFFPNMNNRNGALILKNIAKAFSNVRIPQLVGSPGPFMPA